MRVVFDANVVAAAVCWSGEPFLCFAMLAQRRVFAFGSTETLEESREIATLLIRQKRPKHNATARLTWYLDKVRLVDPVSLGKQRSRDPQDDPYLAAALGAKAQWLVTFDKDLLVLGKPFGVGVVTPAQLLKRIRS